jgi:hypothetical protein
MASSLYRTDAMASSLHRTDAMASSLHRTDAMASSLYRTDATASSLQPNRANATPPRSCTICCRVEGRAGPASSAWGMRERPRAVRTWLVLATPGLSRCGCC